MKSKIVYLAIIIFLLLSIILIISEKNFDRISEVEKKGLLTIHAIGWNGKYWLIGGRLVSGPSFLVAYDGIRFMDVTPKELKYKLIGNVSWNGTEWIIKELPYTTGWENLTYAFDGKNLRGMERGSLEKPATWEPRETYKACSEEYCLIWSTPGGRLINATLMRYDGREYSDLTKESGIQLPFESVVAMVWNGKYWLIGYGGTEAGGVVKYDGASFTKLILPTPTTGGAILWNGEYWLIGTGSSARGDSGVIVKYDGRNVIDMTMELRRNLR